MKHEVREQYERFPYPPVASLALPRRGQEERLSYDRATRLLGNPRAHPGIQVLVAGAGTLETLLVARANPGAARITAVELSERSLGVLRRRMAWDRWSTRLLFRTSARAPVETVTADLHEWRPSAPLDLIFASNVLHHVEDPAALLARLASWLKPGGLLRLQTYPRQSRIWMRETSRYLRGQGLGPETPRLARAAARAIAKLAPEDPRRSCFESQPERRHPAGLVDAFFHACERPLAPLQWQAACARAGLELFHEDQTETSRSAFLAELLPATRGLGPWKQLQILDDLLELCANPTLWLVRRGDARAFAPTEQFGDFTADRRAELRTGLARAGRLLSEAGVTLKDALATLRREVGPRVSAPPEERPLPGLSILEHGEHYSDLVSDLGLDL